MSSDNTALLQAIDGAMEAEIKARDFYRDASEKSSAEVGKALLTELATFEQSHYDKLKELKDSLSSGGAFIEYTGTKLPTSKVPAETAGLPEKNLDDVLKVLELAIEAENKAHAKYREMAAQTDDARGKSMFLKLAEEETFHRRVLSDEYYQLKNAGGVWIYSD